MIQEQDDKLIVLETVDWARNTATFFNHEELKKNIFNFLERIMENRDFSFFFVIYYQYKMS